MAYFSGMVGTSKSCIAKTVRLTAVHDFPDVVGHVNGNKALVCRKELIPVIQENLFECEAVFADGLHGGEVYTISQSYSPIAPKGRHVQVSETCSAGNPIQVVTRIEVEPAHHSDQHALIPALDDLEARGHALEKMFTDTAYNSGANLIAAAQRGVDLVSPTPGKADPDGIGLGYFDLDLEALRVRACPEGERPIQDRLGSDKETRNLRFDPERCKVCGLALDCPAGKEKWTSAGPPE